MNPDHRAMLLKNAQSAKPRIHVRVAHLRDLIASEAQLANDNAILAKSLLDADTTAEEQAKFIRRLIDHDAALRGLNASQEQSIGQLLNERMTLRERLTEAEQAAKPIKGFVLGLIVLMVIAAAAGFLVGHG